MVYGSKKSRKYSFLRANLVDGDRFLEFHIHQARRIKEREDIHWMKSMRRIAKEKKEND